MEDKELEQLVNLMEIALRMQGIELTKTTITKTILTYELVYSKKEKFSLSDAISIGNRLR